MKNKSYFDGDIFSYIGYSIICGILIVITIGFGTPWAVCIMLRWKTNHTVIDGRRMYFDGNGASLFGHWVVWYLFVFHYIRYLWFLANHKNGTMEGKTYSFY